MTNERKNEVCGSCSRLREDERGWYCAFEGSIVEINNSCSFWKNINASTETDPKYLGNYE